jgi:hypothetical protein
MPGLVPSEAEYPVKTVVAATLRLSLTAQYGYVTIASRVVHSA